MDGVMEQHESHIDERTDIVITEQMEIEIKCMNILQMYLYETEMNMMKLNYGDMLMQTIYDMIIKNLFM
tara:strand:+ start:124 stop:330 length:207 start_codon:yes stop_codon:yes gene_type:complete